MSELEAERLTERELEVAQLMAKGLTNAEIARKLGITFGTAKWHVSQVLAKTGALDRDGVASSLERVTPKPGPGRRTWSLATLLKPLGLAATVVPVAAVGAAAVLVVVARGSETERAVVSTTATLPTPASVNQQPAVSTPTAQPHTCDWQNAQGNLNGGPIDHRGCDFSGVNFGERGMMWNMAILQGANMSGAVISGTFAQADFSNADLRGSRFVQSVFGKTNFSGADLTGADFTNSILGDGDFTGATCPDGTLADTHGRTCLGTQGLRNMPTTRSFAPGIAMIGSLAPDFRAQLAATGAEVSLGTFSGRPLVLAWTASWCFTESRCKDTFDAIIAAAVRHPDVAFLALSMDDTSNEALADAEARGFAFPVAVDVDMAIGAAYRIIGAGMYVVINSEGRVARSTDAAGQLMGLDAVLTALGSVPAN